MTSLLIKSFEHISRRDAETAGGKGASLGEMTQAGIPVPPGFVILADAFEKFLIETDLNVEIDTILHSVDIEKMHTVEHASETIQKFILEAKMPEDIELAIREKFDVLGTRFVAVRSSATAEDSDSAAWAGQLDSFLNTTEGTLLKNVQRCWASLFTPRAIFYRFEKELHKQKISVAVVVQKMVESEFSGIAFSVHPVTEDRNQLIIEAGFGLGEAIVSGQVTPDSYVVEKEPRKIIDINISEQSKALYRKEQGENEWKDLGEKGKEQVLNTQQILELSELIIRIENHYGFPCDIEWAYADGKFYITQSRPITTLTIKDIDNEGAQVLKEKQDKKILTNIFSREKNLLYFCMWDDSDRKSVELLEESLENNIFIIPKKGKGSVWYEREELQELKENFLEKFKDHENNLFWNRIQDLSSSSWNFIEPYAIGVKSIQTVDEFDEYYNHLVNFWTCLSSFIYEVLDDNRVDPTIKKEFTDLRNKTEKYTEQMSTVLNNFIDHQPELGLIMNFVTKKEILAILDGSVDVERFYCRSDGCFMLNGNVFPLSQFDQVLQEQGFTMEHISIDTKEVIGNIAYEGIVRGYVRVVYSFDDLAKVQSGDVLVTEMTNPKYLSAFQKSVAVVTDQGGTLCHAAITARELKKPCVIGTKFATQILHDGDLVEVDADNGVVRLLKKA
ncbi:MAG: PEP/pyruvate-binding domain-containing protein [Candidatus Moraniibacteriota bacterium]